MKIENLSGLSLENVFRRDDFGIYIHVPFCMRRCRYCAFVSSTPREVPEQAYVQALLNEFALRYPEFAAFSLKTLYFGGGTPTMLSDAAIGKIVDAITKVCGTPMEISLEVNPEHVTPQRCASWKSLGFTRISLGIQSFDQEMLAFLGRRHDAVKSLAAIDMLHHAGVDEISIDLIYGGRPDEAISDDLAVSRWRRELDTARSCALAHASCYELTLEPHTPLWTLEKRGHPVLCTDEAIAEMMAMIPDGLGMTRYEVSNYSRNDFYSAHNLGCWAGISYLGLGVAAHSLCTGHRRFVRQANTKNIKQYLASLHAGVPVCPKPEFVETLSSQVHLAERLICAARTQLWFDPYDVADQIGADLKPFLPCIDKAVRNEWMESGRDGRLRTTNNGIRLNNLLDSVLFEGCE